MPTLTQLIKAKKIDSETTIDGTNDSTQIKLTNDLGTLKISRKSVPADIAATGNVSASGNVTGNNFSASGNISGGSISTLGNISGGSISTSGNISGGNISGGNISASTISVTTITAAGEIHASKVWNAVYNDYADFQKLNDKLEYGKCYYDTLEGARICNKRCQMSVIGIASDTFGSSVGSGRFAQEVPIGVSGWVLACVDKQYEPGTPLTNDENGHLTEMTLEEKRNYPERLVAIYKSPEYDNYFVVGENKIEVKGRHWVKVK